MADRSTRPGMLPRLVAWLFVGIPAAWAIGQVAIKSAALFK